MIGFYLAVALAPQETPLMLVCGGGGSANKVTTSSAQAWDNNSNTAGATITGHLSQGFQDQVDVVIDGEKSRIRMPRTMLPAVRGGEDGWFKLKNLKVNDGSFSASAAVNFINNPKIFIDRRTGTISISGRAGDYSGRCERVEAGAATKF
jgi:hypothetical protein